MIFSFEDLFFEEASFMARETITDFVGASAIVQKEVERKDTAISYGTKDLPEFMATPAYVALMIQAATEAVASKLTDEETTIGRSMSFVHEQPTMLGMLVSVKASVERVEGRTLFFKIEAYDELGPIGHGTHERQLVHKRSMVHRAEERGKMINWKGRTKD